MKIFIGLFLLILLFPLEAQKSSFILDADTGNEMDDLYAIVKAIQDENCEVIGLLSAHFNNVQLFTDSIWNSYPTKGIKPLEISQQLNELLLKELDAEMIPHPRGCNREVGYSWGYYKGAPVPTSEGVDFIIEMSRKASPTNKLNIVTLGAVTNVASAILTAPEIAKNIRVYSLNMKYDKEKKAWNKNSFNARCDINALDLLLNNEDLELIIMPGNIARELVFSRMETQKILADEGSVLSGILSDRWDHVKAGDSWIMWDLALIEAIIFPKLATLEYIDTPAENTQRKIGVYTDIEEELMRKEFWRTYLSAGE